MPQPTSIHPEDVLQDLLPVVRNAGGSGICASYRAGHKVHTTQVRLAGEDVGTRGRLVRTSTGFALAPLDGAAAVELRCHRPSDIDRLIGICGSDGWRLSHGLLAHGSYGVSVAVGDQELGECRAATATDGRALPWSTSPVAQRPTVTTSAGPNVAVR